MKQKNTSLLTSINFKCYFRSTVFCVFFFFKLRIEHFWPLRSEHSSSNDLIFEGKNWSSDWTSWFLINFNFLKAWAPKFQLRRQKSVRIHVVRVRFQRQKTSIFCQLELGLHFHFFCLHVNRKVCFFATVRPNEQCKHSSFCDRQVTSTWEKAMSCLRRSLLHVLKQKPRFYASRYSPNSFEIFENSFETLSKCCFVKKADMSMFLQVTSKCLEEENARYK